MKSFLRLLPAAIFPYAYILFPLIFAAVFSVTSMDSFSDSDAFGTAVCITVIAYMVLALISAVCGSVYAARSGISPRRAARLNLVVKAVQIPAYIFHFIIGLLGSVASVWGIGFVAFAVIIDVLTIALTGIHAIGCTVGACRGGAVTGKEAILYSIGSFIFCIDLVIAVILMKKCRSYTDEPIRTGVKNAV